MRVFLAFVVEFLFGKKLLKLFFALPCLEIVFLEQKLKVDRFSVLKNVAQTLKLSDDLRLILRVFARLVSIHHFEQMQEQLTSFSRNNRYGPFQYIHIIGKDKRMRRLTKTFYRNATFLN